MRITIATLCVCGLAGAGRLEAEEPRYRTPEELVKALEEDTTWRMDGLLRTGGYDYELRVRPPFDGRSGSPWAPLYENWYPFRERTSLPLAFLDRESWLLVAHFEVGGIWDFPVLEASRHAWYDHLAIHLRTADGARRLSDLPITKLDPLYETQTYKDEGYHWTKMPLGRRGQVTISIPTASVRAGWGSDFRGRAILEFWLDTRGTSDLTPTFLLASYPLRIAPPPTDGDDLANHIWQDARIASFLYGDYQAALSHVDRLYELKPKSILARMLRADILEDAGRPEEAVAVHEEAGALLEKHLAGEWGDPDHVDPAFHQAWVERFSRWSETGGWPSPGDIEWGMRRAGEWPKDEKEQRELGRIAGYYPYSPYNPYAAATRVWRRLGRDVAPKGPGK